MTTPTPTSAAPRDGLAQFLFLCETLHGESSTSSSISLRQLVPVHASLCQAVMASRKNDTLVVVSTESLDSVIASIFDNKDKDGAWCRDRLLSNTNTSTASPEHHKRQLMVLQYCLQYFSQPLQGLVSLVLPWLLQVQVHQQLPETSSSNQLDTPLGIPSGYLELAEASLDAVVTSTRTATSVVSLQQLQHCTEACLDLESNNKSEWNWTIQGRVLLRLHQWILAVGTSTKDNSNPQQQEQQELVIQALLQKCTQAIQQQHNNPTLPTMVAWLRPLTNDWLPYLLSHWNSQHQQQLWQCLWDAYQDDSLSSMVATTSVLCAIIPHLANVPLPTIGTGTTRAIPCHHAPMWDLIHACLRQGIPRHYHNNNNMSSNNNSNTFAKGHPEDAESQMLRRRGLYLLRMILPQTVAATTEPPPKSKKANKKQPPPPPQDPTMLLWKQYSRVLETLEMESEHHLIEQVWDTMAQVLARTTVTTATTTTTTPPAMTWHWAQLLLARVLTSYDQPGVRKLALYRFLNGQAGIVVVDDDATTSDNTKTTNNNNKKKGNQTLPQQPQGAPLTLLTPSFVCEIVLVSFDSLLGGVGTNLNLDQGSKQVQQVELVPLLSRFLKRYYQALSPPQQRDLLQRLWQKDMVNRIRSKLLMQVWEGLANAMSTASAAGTLLELDNDPSLLLGSLVQSMQHLFATASLVRVYQESLLMSLATMLSHTRVTSRQAMNPKTILQVLALFDVIVLDSSSKNRRTTTWNANTTAATAGREEEKGLPENDAGSSIDRALQQWLRRIGDSAEANDSKDNLKWISMVASTVASAFVRGELLSSSQGTAELWEPKSGATKTEREIARAIAYLCTLVGRSTTGSPQGSGAPSAATTAGELLWPAIHKGIANVPVAMVGTAWTKADCVTRALLLLEEGCRMQVLSGMGNGDLIVDRKTEEMMPPPPNIESLLESSVKFVLHHISFLMADDPSKKEVAGGASRSGDAKRASNTFASLISQIQLFHEAYPSSMAVSNTVDEMLKSNLQALQEASMTPDTDIVKQTALTYAALSCGATLPDEKQLLEVCRMFLLLKFQKMPGHKRSEEQIARSVFYFAKWGAMSCLLPLLLGKDDKERVESPAVDDFLQDFRKTAFGAVHGIPVDAMMAFFNCITIASRRQLSPAGATEPKAGPDLLSDIIDTLMAIMEERMSSHDALHMLNEFCGLIFQPELLLQEYQRLRGNPVSGATPIRDAFRKLISLAGTTRPHISRVVLCRATVGWLGCDEKCEEGHVVNTRFEGLSAIAYRKDIVEMLLHKESRTDPVTANQSIDRSEAFKGAFALPDVIDESSVGRGYVLIFFSKLPDPQDGLHSDVLKDLVHHTIFSILEKVGDDPKQKKKKPSNQLMLGSDEYVVKIRGWQALCCLSRFVTDDIVATVCQHVLKAMAEPLHQQIRYFLEVFTLQCARKHPSAFGKAILENITRRDLALQHMTSIMILAGNLIVGRYRLDFFTQYEDGAADDAAPLNKILAGTIPWLGSTQGFSRGIAQLLTHALIPLVVDVGSGKTKAAGESSNALESDGLLTSIYRFLDENPEMTRLRQKSASFFDSYDVDEVCTPKGMLSIPVDEGGEAFPVHMTDIMKQNLQEVYEEANEREYPQWKYLEDMINAKAEEDDRLADSEFDVDDLLVNFQRKIIPLDELNLALESMREKRLRNVAGKKKQKLIVCASLIDKVPNLGGLARTAEIFAAEKLVIPDIGVTKMDNFKTFSVSAGDWIEIEECKEENLLTFLRSHRARGYYIVGLEQTSSSVSLDGFRFPDQPILLLLGKEKEGIPVEFLQTVDQCVEIPQMGITRSLNVHVSGAIAIWEHTKQRMGGFP